MTFFVLPIFDGVIMDEPLKFNVVDTGYAGICHSQYWMPIHFDAIEDGQNKNSHLLFYNCGKGILFFCCTSIAKKCDIYIL